jgi:hypothetical protein
MATRNSVLTTAKALDQALCQAEFDVPATDPAPFFAPHPTVEIPILPAVSVNRMTASRTPLGQEPRGGHDPGADPAPPWVAPAEKLHGG